MRRALYIFFTFFLCSLLAANKGYASHAAGGEIIYEWLHDSTYRFYLKFYRDCSGIAEPTSQALCYFNSCNTQKGSLTLTKVSALPDGTPNGSEVSPGCPDYPTRCNGTSSSLPGYREWWYSGELSLPSRCAEWTFYVSISSRNTSTNIGTGNLYIEATLNNLDVQNNSSPFFSVKPVPYVCLNSPYSFNNGAADPDRDSLVFEFIRPRTAPTACAGAYNATQIAYSGNFNINEPFNTGNTFNFNTSNGEMTFTPAAQSVNTVSVRVSDYRNGKKLGSVMRDVQIQVRSCTNPPTSVTPISSSIVGGQLIGGMIEGAANQALRFCYNITSDSPGRMLIVTDNHVAAAPGSFVSYTGQGNDRVTGCFSWTPACADTGLKVLTVTVKDSTCEPPGIAVARTFTIPVYIRSGSVTERTVIICSGEEVQLLTTGGYQAEWSVLPGGSPISSLSCTSCNNPVASPEITTVYEGRSGSGSCHNTDRVRVRVDNDTNVVTITPADPFVLCKPGYVELDVDISGPRPLTNLPCGPTAMIPQVPIDTVEIIPANAPVLNFNNPASTPFAGDYNVTSRHQYLLHASDLRAAGMYSGTLRSLAFHVSSISNGAVYENLTISLKCTEAGELDRTAGFVQGTVPVYAAANPVTVPVGGGYVYFSFDVPYNWDTTQNLVVDICYTNRDSVTPAYTYFFNTGYQSTLYAFAPSGSICNGQPAATVYSTHELPQMRFGYQLAPEAEFAYRWGNSLFEPSAIGKTPRTYISESTDIWVQSVSRHGCTITDTLHVVVPPAFRLLPEDAAVCRGDSLQLIAEHSAFSQWYENGFQPAGSLNCSSCNNPFASPLEDVVYTAVLRNDENCIDTLYLPVRVKPLPDVRILNADTSVRYGAEVQLIATGAERYYWTPFTGLNNPQIPNPVLIAQESMEYVVSGISDGCIVNDTVHVDVDMRDKLMVPNAFSPNGDGRNDVFRVANLSFQKIVEFRVVNRWGKEVYNALSDGSTTGWDGTLNGEPQPMDSYRYIIRVGYPDGYMETYTGDVTLVR